MKGKFYLRAFIALFFIVSVFLNMAHAEDTVEKTPAQILKEREHGERFAKKSHRISTFTMNSKVVRKIQTAVGYVSTIDLPEKVLEVFVGDQDLFKVEVYGNRVTIKPLTDESDARTNLLIVTVSGRLSFDVSVGPPETADFVRDFRKPEEEFSLVQNAFDKKIEQKTAALEKEFKEKEVKLDEKAKSLADSKLKEAIKFQNKTVTLKNSASKDDVRVNLLTLSQVGDKTYLRFSVLNYSEFSYKPLKVLIGAVKQKRGLTGKKDEGFIEFPSELSMDPEIQAGSYAYGLLTFESRALVKNEKPAFKMIEEVTDRKGPSARVIEIKGFRWLT